MEMTPLHSLWTDLRPYRKQCIIGPLFKLIEAILELTIPILTAQIIDRGVARGDTAFIARTGLLMLAIITAGLCSALVCQYSAAVASQGFGTRVRSALFAHINRLSHAQIDRLGAATLVTRLTNDVNQLQLGVAMMIRLIIRTPFVSIGSVIAAMLIDWKLALIILASMPLFVLTLWLIMRKTFPLYTKVQKKLDTLSKTVQENLSGVRVIRAFSRTAYERDRFDGQSADLADTVVRVGRISSLTGPVPSLIMNAAVIAILWFGGFRVQSGAMTTGEILAFVNYVAQILAALIVLANLVVIFTKAYASLGRVREVFALQPDITDGPGAQPDAADPDAVRLEHVSFSYDAGEPVLEDLTLHIPRGETLGVIGATGSGKTTLIGLVCRFFDATAGAVYVDGADVRSYRLKELRGKIGLVAQKNELFSGTIADNIRWGDPDADDEQVRFAARVAQAAEFIEKKADGYQSRVERGGVNLSGGQRQRLSIARAVCRRPEILILDDASSALDYATEAALRAALRKLSGTTVLLVSQRAAAVRHADRILVLDDGRVSGLGTHAELMETCEVYREIVASQQSGAQAEKEGGAQ